MALSPPRMWGITIFVDWSCLGMAQQPGHTLTHLHYMTRGISRLVSSALCRPFGSRMLLQCHNGPFLREAAQSFLVAKPRCWMHLPGASHGKVRLSPLRRRVPGCLSFQRAVWRCSAHVHILARPSLGAQAGAIGMLPFLFLVSALALVVVEGEGVSDKAHAFVPKRSVP